MTILSAAGNYYPKISTPGASLGPNSSFTNQVIEGLSDRILENQQSSQSIDNDIVYLCPSSYHPPEGREEAQQLIQQTEAVLAEKQATLFEQSKHVSKSDTSQNSLEEECTKIHELIIEMKSTFSKRNSERDSLQEQVEAYRKIIQNLSCTPQETQASLTSMLSKFLDREIELKQYTTDVVSLKYEKPNPTTAKKPPQLIMQEKLKCYRHALLNMSDEIKLLENLVQKALEQLGPGACNDQFRGESNRQLRKKIISLFSDISLYNLRLPQESLLVIQKIQLLRAKHLKLEFDSHTKTIWDFKRSPDHVIKNWTTYQVKETSKEVFRNTHDTMLKKLNLLHSESLVVYRELTRLLNEIKPVEVYQNYPEVLAHGDKDQMQNNTASFEKYQKDIEVSQANLKEAINTVYNELLVSHKEFRLQLAYLTYVTADNNPGMTMAIKGWRSLVTLDKNELPMNLEAKTTTPSPSYLNWLWGSPSSSDIKANSDPLISSMVVLPEPRHKTIPIEPLTTTISPISKEETKVEEEVFTFERRPQTI